MHGVDDVLVNTRVYIDGFNLYYGALKKSQDRWLDLQSFADQLAGPTRTVDLVLYCTAMIKPRPGDPDAGKLQQVYLRALRTLPRVEIAMGKFSVKDTDARRRSRPTCSCCQQTPAGCECCREDLVPIIKTEEKGTDVNLAVRLVQDAYEGLYDDAFVVSDDSDLQGAVDIVRSHLGKDVFIASPRNRPHHSIVGTGYREIRPALLHTSHLANPVIHSGKMIHKPRNW